MLGASSFGASLLHKLGCKHVNDIAQRMRQLARLCVRLTKIDRRKKVLACSLNEFINAPGFDDIIEAIESECEGHENENGHTIFKNPNLALKLGHSLLKVAKLKLGSAIRSCDMEAKRQAEDFIFLHSSDFTDLVATPAHASVKLKPRTLDDFPDFDDLVKLKTYQNQVSLDLCSSLMKNACPSDWRRLAEITMSRILVFNARRGSEVADLKVCEYKTRSNAVHSNVEDNLSEADRTLIKR
jgi:hypothetical protein